MVRYDDINKCKDVLLSYLDIKPNIIDRSDEEFTCINLDHPLLSSPEYLCYNDRRPYVIDELNTEEGWASFRKGFTRDLRRVDTLYGLMSKVESTYRLKYVLDIQNYISYTSLMMCLCMSELEYEMDQDEYDNEAVCNMIKRARDKAEPEELNNDTKAIDTLVHNYVYKLYTDDAKDSILWHSDWLKLAFDATNKFNEEPVSRFPIKLLKMKVDKDAILYFDEVEKSLLVDLDYVKNTSKSVVDLKAEV